MVTKQHRVRVEPWQCPKCHAWAFIPEHVHAVLCPLYRREPVMVADTVKFYESGGWKLPEPEKKPKRRRKKVEEDTGLQAEKRPSR